MLRLTDIKLPLDHAAPALRQAVLARLKIADSELLDLQIAKRSYDARKRGAIVLIYSLDVALRDEASVLARFKDDAHVVPSPDVSMSSSRGKSATNPAIINSAPSTFRIVPRSTVKLSPGRCSRPQCHRVMMS